ncbi:TadD Flp pilus assembly protein TadD, contains TPR repeats [Rhabdaerophilaceae bacterium]
MRLAPNSNQFVAARPGNRLNDVRRALGVVSLVALAALTSGCASRLGQFKGSVNDVSAPGNSPNPGTLEALAARYDSRPGDKALSLAYSSALRASGQHMQAVAVLERASIGNVGDRDVAAAYGRALGDVGRYDEAMSVLSQAHLPDRPDWRVLSSQGVIADQMGKHSQAREYYEQALKIQPDAPTVLTNLGLSYLLSRDLAKAEEILARAAAMPQADPRTSANLALVRKLRTTVANAPQPNGPTVQPAKRAATSPKPSAP